MKFGLQHPSFSFDGSESQLSDKLFGHVNRAEDLGFDSFWLMDHFHQIGMLGPPQEPMLEGWTTISALSGTTSKIRFGTLVTGVVYRHPSILAKMSSTLDVLSKGRLWMGIGAAWNEEEAKAYGIPFPPAKERLDRLEEAVQIVLKMWTEEKTTFEGKYYQIKDAYCYPKPVQKPHPPLMIGGAGEQRTLKIVAKYADGCNLFGSPETIKRKLLVLRNHCNEVGTNYNSLLKTKLSHLIIDKNKETLEKRINQTLGQMPEEEKRERVIYGTPDNVREQIQAFEDSGIEYMIFNFQPNYESQDMELFSQEIIK